MPGDRIDDDWALYISVPIAEGTSDNFDNKANITVDTKDGYLCCLDNNSR